MSQRFVWSVIGAAVALGILPDVVAQSPPATEPAVRVEVRRAELRDEKRDRIVPVKFYIPAADGPGSPCGPALEAGRAPMPLVLLSHGLGGTCEVAAYLGEYWAARGYVVCALQHPGSDDSVWRNVPAAQRMDALRAATRNPQNALDRPRDVSFVIDTLLAEHERGEGVGALIDPQRIAAAGHSFGAYTVMAVAGQRFGPRGASMGDPRVKAVISMSGQPPRNDPAVAYAGVKIPILHLTGTEDRSPINPDVTPEDRQAAFRGITAPDQVLIVFKGADHGVFSGVGAVAWRQKSDPKLDETIQSLVQRSTLLFLDAFLKGDAAAKAKLEAGALQEMVGPAGTVQRK